MTMTWAISDSSASILLLARNCRMRDCLVTARTLFETTLNAAFIICEGEAAAERANLHAIQRSIRDLERESTVGNTTIRIKQDHHEDLKAHPLVKRAIEEFTSPSGKELTSWTATSIAQRIAAIEKYYGEKVASSFHFSLFALYGQASEVSHGTLYSSWFALGLTPPSGAPASPKELAEHQVSYINMILLLLTLCLDSFIQGIASKIDAQIEQANSEKITKSIGTLEWLRKNHIPK